MRASLGARLALIFAGLVALTVLLTAGFGVSSTNRTVLADVDQFLENRASEIVDGQRQAPVPRRTNDNNNGTNGNGTNGSTNNNGDDSQVNDAALQDAVTQVGGPRAVEADAEVQALSKDGQIVTTTGIVLPVDDEDRRVADKRSLAITRTIKIDGNQYRIRTQHLDGGGAIQVAQSLEETNDLLGSIRNRLLGIGLVLSAFAGLGGWLIARRATQPLRRLTKSVERVAATQDLSTPIVDATNGLDRGDEIGRLANGFDQMLGALASSRDQQHRLVQDAAHELRTPLTSIQANVDLLAHAPDLDESVRQETLTGIKAELVQLRNVFGEIVELATDARDAEPHVSVDLRDVISSAVGKFQLRKAAVVQVRSDVANQEAMVIGDGTALERALANLLGNAEKYSGVSPAGSDAFIEVSLTNGSVAVRDHGPGIPDDEKDRVFDRFFRSEGARTQSGSGLGLAIVQKIVEDHGGHAWVQDAPGGGAIVGFTLPPAMSPTPGA